LKRGHVIKRERSNRASVIDHGAACAPPAYRKMHLIIPVGERP